jgi:hypothetical protein
MAAADQQLETLRLGAPEDRTRAGETGGGAGVDGKRSWMEIDRAALRHQRRRPGAADPEPRLRGGHVDGNVERALQRRRRLGEEQPDARPIGRSRSARPAELPGGGRSGMPRAARQPVSAGPGRGPSRWVIVPSARSRSHRSRPNRAAGRPTESRAERASGVSGTQPLPVRIEEHRRAHDHRNVATGKR